MSKRILSLVLALVMVLGTFGTAFAAATTPTGNEKVDKLIELGLVKGDANGYRLADNITRAEVATMVVRALDLEAVANASAAFPSQFKDMNSANVLWARGHVNVAAGQGIVNGYPEDGTFKPANNVTYAEAAAMLVRVLNGMTAAEQANAVWPTTYLAKAAQLGIFADVDGVVDYNAPANRENLFEMVFNALTAGTDLLIANTVEGLVVENYRTEALAKDEVVVHVMNDQNARDDKYDYDEGEEFKVVVTPELAEKGVDVETLLGKVVKVSYDKAGKVVGVEINNNYDYLEGKLSDITTRDLELNDKEYTVVKSESRSTDVDRLYQVYQNNADIAYDKLKAEYANITVRNGKVLFIDAYQFDDVAPVAKDIDAKDRVAYYDDSQDGEIRTLTVDEDAYVINFVDGEMQLGDYKDISANDVIHWYESAKEQLTVIVRPSEDNKVEGEFEKASASRAKEDSSIKITVDGEEYPADVKDLKRDPVYSTLMSGHNFFQLTEDYKAELADFEDKDVVVLRDIFGKVQLIASETTDGTFYALVLQVLNNEFKLLRADNTSEYYTTNIRNTEFFVEGRTGVTEEAKKDDFKVGTLVKVSAKDDLIEEMTLLGQIDVAGTEKDVLAKKVDRITKNLIELEGEDEKYTDSNTIVFVDKGSKNSKAMSLADFIKDYKNPSETDAAKKGTVKAFYTLSAVDRRTTTQTVRVIVVTEAELKTGSYDTAVVKVDRVYFEGTDKVELRVKASGLDGDLTTYKVTDATARAKVNSNEVVKGSIIKISLTKTDAPEIKVIEELLDEAKETTYKVTAKSGNVITLAGLTGEYRLGIGSDVFGEILKDKFVAIKTDAVGSKVITVADVRDENVDSTPSTPTGTVSYKNAADNFVSKVKLNNGEDLKLNVVYTNEGTSSVSLLANAAKATLVKDGAVVGAVTNLNSGALVVLPGKSVTFNTQVSHSALATGKYTLLVSIPTSATTTIESTIEVEVVASSNADLSALAVTGSTLNPAFAANKTEYTVKLVEGTTGAKAINTATAAGTNATVVLTAATKVEGTLAERTATAKVTAEDGTVKTYTVVFEVNNKPVVKNALGTLEKKVSTVPAGTQVVVSLANAFEDADGDTLSYSAAITTDVSSIIDSVVVHNGELIITIKGTPAATNTATITVTANDGLETVTNVLTLNVIAD